MLTIIAFILILGILVLVHELGHFFSAIKLGVDVEEFGIGFPPRMFKIKRKGIIYSINWIPIGGFVKIKGESGDNSEDPKSFVNQPAWKKTIILSAGVIMNFFLAFILLSIGFFVGLPQAFEKDLPNEDIRDRRTLIIEVAPQSPAEKAGLKIGDQVVMFNEETINDSDRLYNLIKEHNQETIGLTIKRGEEEKVFNVKPEVITEGGQPILGIGMIDAGIVSYGFWASIWQGLKTTVLMIGQIFAALYNLLANLITKGQVDAALSGPIGVAVITGQVVKLGWIYILQFAAVLSINLGVVNILPFPALDGGRLLFVLAQKLSRRKLSDRVEAAIHNSGFILLMILFVFITWRDVSRYGRQIWEGIKNIF